MLKVNFIKGILSVAIFLIAIQTVVSHVNFPNTVKEVMENKSEESIKMDLYWFKVNHASGSISATPISPEDLDVELCLSPEDELPICAVAFASPTPLTSPPVNNITQTDLENPNGEETAGARYQEED